MISRDPTTIDFFNLLINITSKNDIPSNYINQFLAIITNIMSCFAYRDHIYQNVRANDSVKIAIERTISTLDEKIRSSKFILNFFEEINFFDKNISIFGANGSGKTKLSNRLKEYLHDDVVISAQRLLIIPTFTGISDYKKTSETLVNYQKEDKPTKITYKTKVSGGAYNLLNKMGTDFEVILDNLLAERNLIVNKHYYSNESPQYKRNSKLDKAFDIWNQLITHRKIFCEDGINIELKIPMTNEKYK